MPVSCLSPDYDIEATRVLIQLFRACSAASLVIFFDDNRIPGVLPLAGHDKHFHAQFQTMKRKHLLLTAIAISYASIAYASAKKNGDGTYTSAAIHYLLYSNDLDEAQAPTAKDQGPRLIGRRHRRPGKRNFRFDRAGPETRLRHNAGHTSAPARRHRLLLRQGAVVPPYTCHFGFNLNKGKSIAGATC